MSDFLSNLVERSLFPIAGMRPQLFSIFEPLQSNGGAFFRGNQGREVPATEHDQQELFDWHSPLHRRTTAPAPYTQFIAIRPKSSSSSGETPESPSMRPQIPRGVDLEGKEESVMQSPLRRAAGDGTSQDEPRLPDKHTQSPPDASKPAPHQFTSDRSHESGPKIIEITTAGRDGRRELIEVREVQTASRPALPKRPIALPLQPKNSSGAASINVTIGRVEVRAVPPPTRRNDKPKPAAGLTLEDYLRRRSKGGAR